jgi:6-phospho-beta-glucosidase
MKIAVIGAAGVRTPLLVEAFFHYQDRLPISELALMDIDQDRLELIGALTAPLDENRRLNFKLNRTTDPRQALTGADFVIMTFRVGGIQSRIIDERVPLDCGVLGQETTGPGGFAMGLRSIPVLLEYVDLMRSVCPQAWLINFANPAGMLTEAVLNIAGWPRAVGICDAPAYMTRVAAALLNAAPEDVFLDYFGLNHLGWVRSVFHQGTDYLPHFIDQIGAGNPIPGLPFHPDLIRSLGMIPNEYNFYYYYRSQAVDNILKSGRTRGEQIAEMNESLFDDLANLYRLGRPTDMLHRYHAYLDQRGSTYMASETGKAYAAVHQTSPLAQATAAEGYAGVALNLIEALAGGKPKTMVLNIANNGSISGMGDGDVVEIPTEVSKHEIIATKVGEIPLHSLGLMKQVKAYEQLTISASVERSYEKALLALTIHPLVSDYNKAKEILDLYIEKHRGYFPL